jgi:hypothetical protein
MGLRRTQVRAHLHRLYCLFSSYDDISCKRDGLCMREFCGDEERDEAGDSPGVCCYGAASIREKHDSQLVASKSSAK